MSIRGEQTRRLICTEAYKLFAARGYKDITMQDICEAAGLSRGGLYRHYSGTEQIFLEILSHLLESQQNEFSEKIRQGIPATEILEDVFLRYEREMIDSGASLSTAIYEFFSDPEISKSENSVSRQYLKSKSMWLELIRYGIDTNEFRAADPEAVIDLIVFSYQGVRMYSKLMEIDPVIPKRIMEQIKCLLLNNPKGGVNE